MFRRARRILRSLSFEERLLLIGWIVVLWKVSATNWIVVTDYTYMGSDEVRAYSPPASPMWRPPQPGDIAPGAKSWIDGPFFDAGGWGGPVAEPVLKIHWLRMALESVPIGLLAYSVVIALVREK
jgi:hypothetical protein